MYWSCHRPLKVNIVFPALTTYEQVTDRRARWATFMISSLWEIHLTKFAFILNHLLKTQNRKILPWTRNSKQKLIFGNNGSRCFQHKIYSARSWQLPTGINIPLGCCLAPCQLSGSRCKALPGFCVPEQPHRVQCFGRASRSPNESACRFAYWGRDQSWEPCDWQVGKHQKHCFGQVTLWDYPGRKAAQSLQRDCQFPGVQEETKMFQSLTQDQVELGSGGLQTPRSTIPIPCLAAWKPQVHVLQDNSATHTWQQDDFACMFRHKGPAVPRGNTLPPA